MNVILDTHTFLWYVWDSPEISALAIGLIEDPSNLKFVSMASIWEMAIKVGIGKLSLNSPFADLKAELIEGNGFEILPISFDHTVALSQLPFHHKDPFDRLIIAQSLVESMPLISSDPEFDAYGVQRLW